MSSLMDNFGWTPKQIFELTIKQIYAYLDCAKRKNGEAERKQLSENLAARVHGGGGMNPKMMRRIF